MTAQTLYDGGFLAEAAEAANAALAVAPTDAQAGLVLGCALIRLGRFAVLPGLAAHFNATAANGQGWDRTAAVLHRLLADGHHAELIALDAAIPPDEPCHILTAYYCGCARMMGHDMTGAMERFDWFRRHVRFYADHIAFAAHPLLSMIYRQGRIMAGPDEVDRRLAAAPPQAALDHLGGLAPAAADQAALFTCLDEQYFTLFGRTWVEANLALNPATGLHLHVIAPGPDSLAQLDALAQAHPGRFAASVERRPLFHTVTYYASARYFVVDQLIRRHGRAMVSLDGELRIALERLDLARRCRDLDFACFGTGRDEPGSVWQASVMWFGRGPAARRFTETLRAYCWPELDKPSLLTWQLDQAALLACGHHAQARNLDLAFGDLRQILGCPLGDAVADIASAATKDDNKHQKMNQEVHALGPRLGELYSKL